MYSLLYKGITYFVYFLFNADTSRNTSVIRKNFIINIFILCKKHMGKHTYIFKFSVHKFLLVIFFFTHFNTNSRLDG